MKERVKTMKIQIYLYSTMQPLVIKNVENVYVKGGLYCVSYNKKVKKIPLKNIFQVHLDCDTCLKIPKNKTFEVSIRFHKLSQAIKVLCYNTLTNDNFFNFINASGQIISVPLDSIFDIEETY